MQEPVRINKYLSEAGVCSRREADRQVEAGNVTIDGVVASMGAKVLPDQTVLFCGKPVKKEEEMILLAFHKPTGIVCTAEKREKNNVVDYINYPKRIYPIGRLDKDSEGLLLMTNNGDIVNRIMRAGNMHEKEYIGHGQQARDRQFPAWTCRRSSTGGIKCHDAQMQSMGDREKAVWHYTDTGIEPSDPAHV